MKRNRNVVVKRGYKTYYKTTYFYDNNNVIKQVINIKIRRNGDLSPEDGERFLEKFFYSNPFKNKDHSLYNWEWEYDVYRYNGEQRLSVTILLKVGSQYWDQNLEEWVDEIDTHSKLNEGEIRRAIREALQSL